MTTVNDPTLELRLVANLLGDAGENGPMLARLIAAAKHRKLETLGDPEYSEVVRDDGSRYRIERADARCVNVTRAALAAWLTKHGTDNDRASAAATWANSNPEQPANSNPERSE